jgi:hypothetical protein
MRPIATVRRALEATDTSGRCAAGPTIKPRMPRALTMLPRPHQPSAGTFGFCHQARRSTAPAQADAKLPMTTKVDTSRCTIFPSEVVFCLASRVQLVACRCGDRCIAVIAALVKRIACEFATIIATLGAPIVAPTSSLELSQPLHLRRSGPLRARRSLRTPRPLGAAPADHSSIPRRVARCAATLRRNLSYATRFSTLPSARRPWARYWPTFSISGASEIA